MFKCHWLLPGGYRPGSNCPGRFCQRDIDLIPLVYAALCIISCCSFYLEFTSFTDSTVTKDVFALQTAYSWPFPPRYPLVTHRRTANRLLVYSGPPWKWNTVAVSAPRAVACRGGAEGAPAPGIQPEGVSSRKEHSRGHYSNFFLQI